VEIERRTRDGDTIYLSISTAPIRDATGTITGVMAVAKDITESRMREQDLRATTRQLQTVLESVRASIFIKDADGQYQLMNSKCRELMGIDPETDIVGLTDADLFPGEKAEQFRADDERVLAEGETLELEEEIPTPSGVRTCLTVKSPIFDDDGTPSGICAVSTDITARNDSKE
jgi:PAS domain S-box-containing protein